MRNPNEIREDIQAAKTERRKVKAEFGKRSIEYAEARERLDGLREELDFSLLHYE